MCGHGTIGLGITLVETGMVAATEPTTAIRLDTPAGPVAIEATVRGGRATSAAFVNVPAFVFARGVDVPLPGNGDVALGTTFDGRIVGDAGVGPFAAIVPWVSGTAYVTGMHQFVFDPADPLRDGFLVG